MTMNPLITQSFSRIERCRPRSAGEGVALPLGTPFRDAGTGRIGQPPNPVARDSRPEQE